MTKRPAKSTCTGQCRTCRYVLPTGLCCLDLADEGPMSDEQIANELGCTEAEAKLTTDAAEDSFRCAAGRLECRALADDAGAIRPELCAFRLG
jgi:hypothetical protein